MSKTSGDRAWAPPAETTARLQSRRRGNLFIALALTAFVAFTLAMVAWRWDTGTFLEVTQEREARVQQLEAQRDAYEASLSRSAERAAQQQATDVAGEGDDN